MQLCNIKKIIVILILLSTQFGAIAANTDGLCMIAITDSNNERISGATVEVLGTGKVYYSNINGYCYIPKSLLAKSGRITINSISYKTVYLNTDDMGARIVLQSR